MSPVFLNEKELKEKRAQQFLSHARAVVEDHYTDPDFKASVFASELRISRMHLHRKLKKYSGMSTTSFIRMIRLEKAAELLSNRSANIAQITFEVGFNHLSYFSRCFKDKYGFNPSEYSHRHKVA